MGYPVARLNNLVKVGDSIGQIIQGVDNYLVDTGGGVSSDGTSPEVATYESIGMETEEMTAAQKRAYITSKYGAATADALDRATSTTITNPGSTPANVLNANSAPVSCSSFTNSSADSTQISKYYTVSDFSSGIYQSANAHEIPTTTALGNSRATIICNLSFLAKNSIDPLKDWMAANTPYTFKIGSGFRNNTNGSDHNIGSAADLHVFQNGQRVSRQTLVQVAQLVVSKAGIPFTQFLLEYEGSSSFGWMHIANRQSGQKSPLLVGYTLTGSGPYPAGFPASV